MLRSAGGRLAGAPRGRAGGNAGEVRAPMPAGGRLRRRPGRGPGVGSGGQDDA